MYVYIVYSTIPYYPILSSHIVQPGGRECGRAEICEILQKQGIIPPQHFLHDRPCKFADGKPKKCTIM